ncbi:hypothetical protein BKA62DRAFT_335651 [Auriculariales sp. MPI-PUGE-AT-0066]|nr:hypothetical protein BKA62DRAFT_335651 [Auriculariales sp. MPI-PUGE-AT-0066]
MLVLSSESACDICAEPYSQESLPHSIPCGHTFCSPCLHKVVKGVASQWAPRTNASSCGCPLCREPFNAPDIRRIRIDAAPSSSPPYPQVLPYPNYFPAASIPGSKSAAFGKTPIDEDALDAGANTDDRITSEAKRLEQRVADAAKRRCTFEEISALHREVQQWLDKQGARRPEREHGSLRLSAALLGAILVNGFAYNEAKKAAKGVESTLKDRLDATEAIKRRLEHEINRQRTEVHTLKQEISKLTGVAPPPPPPGPTTTTTTPTPGPTSPSSARPLGSSLGSSLTTTAMSSSHRSQTPAPASSAARSHTPAPSRSQTPGAALSSASSSAYSSYSHHTSSVTPPRSSAASSVASSVVHTPATSRSPERPPAIPGQHQRWLPQMMKREEDTRPGTALATMFAITRLLVVPPPLPLVEVVWLRVRALLPAGGLETNQKIRFTGAYCPG